MRLEIQGTTDTDAAIDLRERSVDRDALVAGIYGQSSPYAVDCPTPGPVHERAGVVVPEMGLKVRTALAAAARSRGIATPHDDRIDRLATELAEYAEAAPTGSNDSLADAPSPDDVADCRERAAELRGQVAALEAMDADPTDARAELGETAARLSELETERIAAAQTRERARDLRDRREQRLRLEDRLANARRDARAALVDRVREEYEMAVATLSTGSSVATGEITSDEVEDPFSVPAPVCAFAVCRVARIRAPIVLDTDAITEIGCDSFTVVRLEDPDDAADWFDAPVICL